MYLETKGQILHDLRYTIINDNYKIMFIDSESQAHFLPDNVDCFWLCKRDIF
jgi:hypothetical protein